jgi:hypothetical protein
MRNGLEERMHEYLKEQGTGAQGSVSLIPMPSPSSPLKENHPCNPKLLKHPPPRGFGFIHT